ncbi:MAG: hypothetical protein NT007_06490 [Candidatus Kapabacteria bacterium]|nr:hypothetical protein [Candidatus Kapabacteria bacterium]
MKSIIKISCFCILFVLVNNLQSFAETIIPSGNVSGNWTVTGSPYKISGHIFVPSGLTLSISPGVRVEFQGHYKVLVQGRVIAIGNLTDSIRFTADDKFTGW